MASAKRDFERFVHWLYTPEKEVPAEVRRLAVLCSQNFDELATTTRHRSQRSVYLAGIARRSLHQTADAAPTEVAEAVAGAWPWKRLHEFTLGPFRGFRTPETFDVSKQFILFYGPNGSGKTSLCEGFEYALLGEVEEAGSKRIAPRTYLTNLHARRFAEPTLTATDHQGHQINVAADLNTYRFCFIEKNRIDAFSRMAARPAAQRAELIATLFGMEQFNDFVGHFNENIDGQLVLIGAKHAALSAKRGALTTDQHAVSGEAESLQALAAEEAALANSYSAGMTYDALKRLIGSLTEPGRLHQLEALLERVPLQIVGVTRQGLIDLLEKVTTEQKGVEETTAALRARSEQVSFKRLYDAVLQLRQSSGDRCPACDTPLTGAMRVMTNPYDKASEGLNELRELGVLQEKQRAGQSAVDLSARELRKMLADIAGYLAAHQEQETSIGRHLSGIPADPAGVWWAHLLPQSPSAAGELGTFDQLLAVADRIEAQDTATRKTQLEREPFINERRRLNEFQLKVQAQDLRRKQLIDGVAAAKLRIAAFDTANAELIAEAAQEKLEIDRDSPLKTAYDRLLEELKAYRDQLPGQLMAGLNETALTLYNAFNRNDLDADKLVGLHLPVTADAKIEIAFKGMPDRRVDALHVLSEGHIRCLGLAILLAKAKSMLSPTIVFDDAINAIDHDHRGGIREAIFENDTFAETQFIVTCHSNEFIKDIQQHLPEARKKDCVVYLFRHHTGDYQPRITRNVPSANYISKARAARDALNDRDALGASRQALEMLSDKVWGWLGSHDLGLLSVALAGVGAEPALRNVCDAVAKKLKKADNFNHANKATIIAAFDRILGIPETNLIWTYLNKGTHEEANRDDFDGELVESVVSTLEQLGALDLRRGK